jgi:hypothetical protein
VAAAAAKGAAAAEGAPATAASAFHELDHASRALQVKNRACLGGELSRREQSQPLARAAIVIPYRIGNFLS